MVSLVSVRRCALRWLALLVILCPAPLFAQESVPLWVNQSHTLYWDWAANPDGSPVDRFVFRCGAYTKEILSPTARSLRFGNLVDEAGVYTGCTLTAENSAGRSAPVAIPAFHYEYSTWSLWKFLLELAAFLSAGTLLVRRAVQTVKRSPKALPEPIIILTTEKAAHVYCDY
jgi:hypothetical protein